MVSSTGSVGHLFTVNWAARVHGAAGAYCGTKFVSCNSSFKRIPSEHIFSEDVVQLAFVSRKREMSIYLHVSQERHGKKEHVSNLFSFFSFLFEQI